MSYRAEFSCYSEIGDLAVEGVKKLILEGVTLQDRVVSEILPGLYICDIWAAENLEDIERLQYTHVLNCGETPIHAGQIYESVYIKYMGFETDCEPAFDLSSHFGPAAEFIHSALMEEGKILVHCWNGRNRSPTVVLAYLMLKLNMSLVTAVKTVSEKRCIFPSDRFIRQLMKLQIELYGY